MASIFKDLLSAASARVSDDVRHLDALDVCSGISTSPQSPTHLWLLSAPIKVHPQEARLQYRLVLGYASLNVAVSVTALHY